jgi:hypothetical protein
VTFQIGTAERNIRGNPRVALHVDSDDLKRIGVTAGQFSYAYRLAVRVRPIRLRGH